MSNKRLFLCKYQNSNRIIGNGDKYLGNFKRREKIMETLKQIDKQIEKLKAKREEILNKEIEVEIK